MTGGSLGGEIAVPAAFAIIFGGATLVSTLALAGIGVGAARFFAGGGSLLFFSRVMVLLRYSRCCPSWENRSHCQFHETGSPFLDRFSSGDP